MKIHTVGTEIYYGGDICNQSDFGIITSAVADKWGAFYDIKLNDGRDIKRLPTCAFSDKYLGHGGTRFVTKAAYNEYREASIATMKAEYEAMLKHREQRSA